MTNISSFSDLKQSTASLAELDRLTQETEKLVKSTFVQDERYWSPLLDQSGNGSALIRFLPRPAGENNEIVKKITYGFRGPSGRWYIENSPKTLGLPDPVYELNQRDENSGPEGKAKADQRRRRTGFISNILVVRHPARPDDEGKVFLFNYGKKIYDKLYAKMRPPDTALGGTRMNPFDPWKGANFRLIICKKDGFRNFDQSEFDFPSVIGTDDEIERYWNKCYSLRDEVAPDKFKSYDELKAKLIEVMDASVSDPLARPSEARSHSSQVQIETQDDPPWATGTEHAEADNSELEFFKNLAKKRG